MHTWNRYAKINVKLLVVLILVTFAVGISLVAARQIRRDILSEVSLKEGQAAYEQEDWLTACKSFKDYLGIDPDNVEILKKYAKARLSIRPLDAGALQGAIAAYRRIIQLDPLDDVAYNELAALYTGIGNFEELAYIARTRLTHDPNDRQGPLWLANALTRLNRTAEARQTLEEFINGLEGLADKPIEYMRACIGMSKLVLADNPSENKAAALKYLDKAVDGVPESAESRITRAQFYARAGQIEGLSDEDRLALARKDLEAADGLAKEDPQILLLLGSEWMAHGELEKAESELHAAENLPPEALKEHFFDANDWVVARFGLAFELAKRKGDTTQNVILVEEALTILKEPRHRIQILPSAISFFVESDKVSDARRCLDEYIEVSRAPEDSAAARLRLAYLQALVAKAEEKPYDVINFLEPVVLNETSRPELWRLLAEAYSRTNQTRRAVSALIEYLRLRPQDLQMTLLLTNEYFKLRDWSKVLETSQTAESLNATNITAQLLRIEAGIHLATGQRSGADAPKLEELSAELAELSREHPDRYEIHRMQAAIATRLERTGETEKELKLAIEKSANPLGAEMQLARHYYQTGRADEAINVCRAACESYGEVAEPWIFLSEIHVANSDPNSAYDCLQKGLDIVAEKSEKRSISIKLAMLELIRGDWAAGIGRLSELAAQDKEEIRARTLLLDIREIRENPETAEKLIVELKEIEGESGLLWRLHEASLWLSSNEWRSKQKGITDHLQHCIASDPGWSAPVLLLAGLYERLEDFSRAEDICRQALARNSSAAVIADRLLALLEKQGQFSEAEQVLQDLRRFDTDPRLTSAWQVRMAVRTGNLSQAIEELKFRISNDEKDANSRIQLARLVYQQNRDADAAFHYLDQAEAVAPDAMALTAARVAILTTESRADDARRILDNSIAKSHSFGAYLMRAEYLSGQGKFERAEEDYRKLTTFAENASAGYELLGDFYVRNEKLDQAMAAIEEGLKEYPDDLRLKQRLMQLLFARGQNQDREKALEILTALEERLPQNPELMKLRAMQMLQEGTPQSVKTAKETLETVAKLAPTAVDAHLTLMNIAIQEGEYETARDLAIRALGLNPDNLALLSARGRIELLLDNPRMAAELAKLVLQKDPNDTEARDLFVAAALNSKDRGLLDEAQTLIDSTINRPTDEGLLVLRARLAVATEQPQAAIPELEAYCQTEEGSQSVAATITLADLYRLTGDMDQAERKIEQAERVDPNSQTVIHARLLWLLAQNRLAELSDISSAYIAASRQNPNTLVVAAAILSASDSMRLKTEGLKLYEHAVKIFPTLVAARLGLASALYQMGDSERAKAAYQKVLEQHPNNIQALNDLAWILQEHDHQYAAALELVNRGLSLVPNDWHLLDTRGTILLNMTDRLAEARNDFETLQRLLPPDSPQRAKTLLKLGRIDAQLNDPNQAKQRLEKALEIDRKTDIFTTDERLEMTRIIQRVEHD